MKNRYTRNKEKRQASLNSSMRKIQRRKDTEERLNPNPHYALTPHEKSLRSCICGHTEEQHGHDGRCKLCTCSKFEPCLREGIKDTNILLEGF